MKKLIFGQSLFEVVIALAVVALLAVALVSVTTISVRNSSYSSNNTQATRFTQSAIEWLRGERDLNWVNFVQRGVTSFNYCLDTLEWTGNTGTCSSDEFMTGTHFLRQLSLTCYTNQGSSLALCSAANIDTVEANITVSWTDSGGSHSVSTPTQLTNWK